MAPWYDEQQEVQAQAYERAQGKIFLLRFSLMFALAAAFWMSGWSQALAEGLRFRFSLPYVWPLIHVVFVAVAVLGYEAMLFPLSVLADYSLEKTHGRLTSEFGGWFRGYLVTLLLEIGLVTAAFTGLYALLRFFPGIWWLPATGIYAILVVGIGEWGPSQLLPRVRPPVPAEDPLLEEELRRIGHCANLEIESAAWWNFEHQEEIDDVCLTGQGRHRRAVYSERAWRGLERREQIFVAARQMAWHRHHAEWAVQFLQVALAGAVFAGAGRIADAAAQSRGLSGVTAPEAFPFLLTALFGLAAVAGVIAHAVVRRMELRADRFALRHAGGSEALRACLQHEFHHQPFAVHAPFWQVWLLRRKPTAATRLAQADDPGNCAWRA